MSAAIIPLLADRIQMPRAQRVALMAAALINRRAVDSAEREAVRALYGSGFSYGEIVALLDEAVAVAAARIRIERRQ